MWVYFGDCSKELTYPVLEIQLLCQLFEENSTTRSLTVLRLNKSYSPRLGKVSQQKYGTKVRNVSLATKV